MEGIKKLFSPDNLSFGLVLGLAFLLPIFFLPIPGIAIDVSKVLIVSVLSLISLALWFADRLIDGRIKVPRSLILLGALIVALSFLASSLASPAINVSLFGQGFEVGTFAFILVGAILLLVTSLVLNSQNRVFWVYAALLVSFGFVALFQAIRLFAGPDTISFGYFNNVLSNTVGKWNDLATFVGFIAVLALTTLEILSTKLLYKVLLYVTLALSLFFLAVANFTFAWGVLAAVSIVLFVYSIYLNKFGANESKKADSAAGMPRIPGVSLVVFLVSIFFFFTAGSIGGALSTYFKTTQVEVRPSWAATYDIAKATLSEHPVLGGGPNRFVNEWALYKPEVLNSTIFWATDFNAGIGLIPTIIVNTGILGLLVWVFFLGSFLYLGIRAILSFGSGRASRYLVLSSFLSVFYLWLIAIFYVSNATIVSLAFLLTGLFVAVLVNENESSSIEFSLSVNPKIGFVSVLVLILLIIASVSFGYVFVEKTIASIHFQKAVVAMNSQGNIDASEASLVKAINLNPNDVYYRGMSQIAIARLSNLLQQKDLKPEAARTEFTNFMGTAVQSAKQAITYDGTNYVNWLNLGGIYEAVVPLGVKGAYEEGDKAYREALKLAPKNPLIYYTLARLETSNKDTKAARISLDKALAMKNDYTDALFFLSQIEASEGNMDEAISKADQASLLAPDNIGLFFQLGFLKYTAKDYEGAISALERATSLSLDYANAMYFLGLSYDKVGRESDAIKQFARISELNPDNQEIKNILNNLKVGKTALSNVPPPQNTPEKNKTPPIKETKPSPDSL